MNKLFLLPVFAIILLSGCTTQPTTTTTSSSQTSSQTSPATSSSSVSSITTSAAQSASVNIQNFAFAPGTITISAGSTVTWMNRDSVSHTVTSDDGSTFTSGNLATGQSFSHTFTQPGTYTYHCAIHPQMHGTIVVQ